MEISTWERKATSIKSELQTTNLFRVNMSQLSEFPVIHNLFLLHLLSLFLFLKKMEKKSFTVFYFSLTNEKILFRGNSWILFSMFEGNKFPLDHCAGWIEINSWTFKLEIWLLQFLIFKFREWKYLFECLTNFLLWFNLLSVVKNDSRYLKRRAKRKKIK